MTELEKKLNMIAAQAIHLEVSRHRTFSIPQELCLEDQATMSAILLSFILGRLNTDDTEAQKQFSVDYQDGRVVITRDS